MSVLVRFSPGSLTRANYDEVQRRLREEGHWPPEGIEYHVCFGTEGSLRVSEIWSSRERFDAFGEHLMPILREVGIDLSSPPEFLEVQNQERF